MSTRQPARKPAPPPPRGPQPRKRWQTSTRPAGAAGCVRRIYPGA